MSQCAAEFHLEYYNYEGITLYCNRDEHPPTELHHDTRVGLWWQADSEHDPDLKENER